MMRQVWIPNAGNLQVLATDGDGTLTRSGHLGAATLKSLETWQRLGRKIFLNTGETSYQVKKFPHHRLFDLVIAENGAVLFDTATGKEVVLAAPPPKSLLDCLRKAGVRSLKRGRVILSTECTQKRRVEAALCATDCGWHTVCNREELMILPPKVDKASGLTAALRRMRYHLSQVVGIGDAENDLPLIESSGFGVAVANALPILKQRAAWVASKGMGSGVVETLARILALS